MALDREQKTEIAKHLREKISEKLESYARETTPMPFHTRLFGEERMATYSFIQSCNTMLGTSIFEQVAEIIAKPHFAEVSTQYDLRGKISNEEVAVIEEILRSLTSAKTSADKLNEVKRILSVKPSKSKTEKSRVDLRVVDKNGLEYFFDVTSPKPNMKEFKELKRKLLTWTALSKKPVVTALAIPYNPYHPQPYERWTLRGLYDLKNEVFVEQDFWDFLGGKGAFFDLLQIFEEVGRELNPKINTKISEIAKATRQKSL
ncbi:MAG: TdeIII family type II restriction endonuclease [Candidatus Micrarchaeota archaeon]